MALTSMDETTDFMGQGSQTIDQRNSSSIYVSSTGAKVYVLPVFRQFIWTERKSTPKAKKEKIARVSGILCFATEKA
ncbi:hypothetical protein LOAG_04308 [Loa loa]|uniref:Uncharacterized protein n=1 Tax=Loa loa TaxID=7209 RepID=A0A1S0U437_LOALO|nr:hypothetical protein LOAG_04308 [Loa loa]EFO24177.2 hypothetical protein LOAG_04308 [Loa loa]